MPSALAADLDVPPPMDGLRPATFDWSGPYVGVFGTAVAVDGTFDGVCSCGGAYTDLEHSGIGYAGGILGGWNYQIDSFVMGIEGDWAFGGEVASNDDPLVLTDLSFNNIATLRARAGFALDNTLLYFTGGLAAADTEFGAVVVATPDSDRRWVYGWTAGGGLEHAFTQNFSGRIEYIYVSLPDADYSLTDGLDTFDATQSFSDIHMVRAGLTYNFGW
ncbi:MAG: outer membrane beta-barrel protein [Aestuariivirga sp.]|nr:outer membrane beta-barrel protein [Aestuariivirga sp.]